MLDKFIIGFLFCIIGIEAVLISMLRRQLRRLEKHCDSWKLAAEHWEKKANGW